jgi:hypothetical protein
LLPEKIEMHFRGVPQQFNLKYYEKVLISICRILLRQFVFIVLLGKFVIYNPESTTYEGKGSNARARDTMATYASIYIRLEEAKRIGIKIRLCARNMQDGNVTELFLHLACQQS